MNNHFPQLNLPAIETPISSSEGRLTIFDPVRRRYVALTPEEWVRQHVVHFLNKSLDFPFPLLQVEAPIKVGTLSKRCDIVGYCHRNGGLAPLLVVECKQPSVDINQHTADQAMRYNMVLHAPFLLLTNGIQSYALKVELKQRQLKKLASLPSWHQMQAFI